MRMPSISEYLRSLDSSDAALRTLGGLAPERDVYGKVKLRAGNSAAVFRLTDGRRNVLLKCYTRPKPRLAAVYDYVERTASELLARQRLLRNEIFVYPDCGDGMWIDAVAGEWTEGETLDRALVRAATAGDRDRLALLSRSFDRMCAKLLREEWAHGDLKPENIVVGSDAGMTLIDCDALFIPELAGLPADEIGTPGFQHPARDARLYDKSIDDYPMALLSVSLCALARDPSLFLRYCGEELLPFTGGELVEGRARAWEPVCETLAEAGDAAHYRLMKLLRSPFPALEGLQRYFPCEERPPVCNPVAFERDGLWGFASPEGRTVAEAFWDDVLDFSEGAAAVRLGRCWHYIDLSGRMLFPPRGYEAAGSFRNGTARVRRHGVRLSIDHAGNESPE